MSIFRDFHWQPNGKILIFVGLFLPLTIVLGFWQLDRADQKRIILDAQQTKRAMPALINDQWDETADRHLRQTRLQLTFDADHYLLLANSMRNGQVGYEVIGVATAEGIESALLVNRGWVPASFDRADLPKVSFPEGEVLVEGYYYCSEENRLIADSQTGSDWPKVIYDLDASLMQQLVSSGIATQPCAVRLENYSPLAFLADWQIVNQSVEKHVGYAVQWFLMATALIILALFANSNLGDLFRGRKSRSE